MLIDYQHAVARAEILLSQLDAAERRNYLCQSVPACSGEQMLPWLSRSLSSAPAHHPRTISSLRHRS